MKHVSMSVFFPLVITVLTVSLFELQNFASRLASYMIVKGSQPLTENSWAFDQIYLASDLRRQAPCANFHVSENSSNKTFQMVSSVSQDSSCLGNQARLYSHLARRLHAMALVAMNHHAQNTRIWIARPQSCWYSALCVQQPSSTLSRVQQFSGNITVPIQLKR